MGRSHMELKGIVRYYNSHWITISQKITLWIKLKVSSKLIKFNKIRYLKVRPFSLEMVTPRHLKSRLLLCKLNHINPSNTSVTTKHITVLYNFYISTITKNILKHNKILLSKRAFHVIILRFLYLTHITCHRHNTDPILQDIFFIISPQSTEKWNSLIWFYCERHLFLFTL